MQYMEKVKELIEKLNRDSDILIDAGHISVIIEQKANLSLLKEFIEALKRLRVGPHKFLLLLSQVPRRKIDEKFEELMELLRKMQDGAIGGAIWITLKNHLLFEIENKGSIVLGRDEISYFKATPLLISPPYSLAFPADWRKKILSWKEKLIKEALSIE